MFLTNIGKIDEALKYLEKVGNPNLFKDVLLKLWDKKFKNFNLSAIHKAKKKDMMSDFILAYLKVLIENNRYRTLEAILKNDIEGNEDVALILELSKQIGVNIIGLLTKALINAQIDWERIPGEFQRTFREKYENSKIEESLSFEESCLLKERTMRFDDVISFYEKKLNEEGLDEKAENIIKFRLALQYLRKFKWQKNRDMRKIDKGIGDEKVQQLLETDEAYKPFRLAKEILAELSDINVSEVLDKLDEYLSKWDVDIPIHTSGREQKNDSLGQEEFISIFPPLEEVKDFKLSVSDVDVLTNRQKGEVIIGNMMLGSVVISVSNKSFKADRLNVTQINGKNIYKIEELNLYFRYPSNGNLELNFYPNGLILTISL